MLKPIFSVRDNAAQVFVSPFTCNTEKEAIRTMMMDMAQPQSMIGSFPEQFDLFQLGSFDTIEGQIHIDGLPRLVCNASSLKKGTLNEGE